MEKKENSSLHIRCSRFSMYEKKIIKISQSINARGIITEKVEEAKELLSIIDALSNCPKYDEKREDCISCQFVLSLKKEIPNLIIKVNKTAFLSYL